MELWKTISSNINDSFKEKSKNFIYEIIDEDLKTNKWNGKVHTRFPPEPNGYLHIGHAKSICLNFGIARDYKGKFNLRFDDTNPTKEDQEYVDSIIEDVKWLGGDFEDRIFYASDYFDKMYEWAVQLIKKGKAYVDDSDPETMRELRGTVTEAGTESPYRNRSVDENLDLFNRMKNGEFKNGAKVLRAKIDMSSPNMNMRDPVMYRIIHSNIIEQEINGVFIQCMILHMDLKILLKELLIRFVHLNLKYIDLYMIGF